MKIYKVFVIVIFTWLLSMQALCQTRNKVEMADVLRSDGKIYTVVAGLVVILTGLIFFMLRVERKLDRIERKEDRSKAVDRSMRDISS